jgi:hypothetical protein
VPPIILRNSALGLERLVERQVHRRLDRLDIGLRRVETSEPLGVRLAELGEYLRLAACGFELLIIVACALQ